MYSIKQSKIIIEGKFEEIKAHLMRLDKDLREEMVAKIIKDASSYSSITKQESSK